MTAPMSPERMAEFRSHHPNRDGYCEACRVGNDGHYAPFPCVPFLLVSEVDRLRAQARVADRQLDMIAGALIELPERCKYHGDNLDSPSYAFYEACCDTGRPSRRRKVAIAALARIRAALASDAEAIA